MKRLLFLNIVLLFIVSCSTAHQSKHGFDRMLSGYQYPYEVYQFNFKSQNQDLVMAYGDIGDKASQKTAVLLHGKNFSGYYWNRIADELVSKGYRVIIPDQIGFGKSSKPDYYQYGFPQLAFNTYRLLSSLDIARFTLVGHSMGGMLAVHMAVLKDDVEKLILVNPIGLENYLQYAQYKDPQFFYQNELAKSVSDFRNYQKQNYYGGKWNDEYEKLLAPFKGWKNGPDWQLLAWNNALTYDPVFTDPIVPLFSELTMDTYLVLGTHDRTGPGRGWKKTGVTREFGRYDRLGKEVTRSNPQKITLIELEGLGHMPQYEDYTRFSKVFFPLF